MTMLQEAPARAVTRPVVTPTIRRRRAVVALSALAAIAVAAALGTGSAAAWGALAAVIVLAAVYMAILRRSRRQAFEREFQALLAGGVFTMDDLADMTELSVKAESAALHQQPATVPTWRRAVGLVRFIVSCILGWALAPLVFALTVLVGKTPKDTTGKRWLANLQHARVTLKEQSRRGIAVSAATAGAAVGTAAMFSGGGVATAAPIVHSASAAAPASVHTSRSSYMVTAGDTLSKIAMRFGTTYEALVEANHISNPDLIFPGEAINIPGGAPSGAAAAGGSTYRVVPGDTLKKIAARFGTSYQTLAEINHIANPNFIEVGQVLHLSRSAAAADPAPATVERSATSYTVAPGDTLKKIAARFGISYQTLAEINHIANPNFIEVGQVLKLRGSAPAVVTVSDTTPKVAPKPAAKVVAKPKPKPRVTHSRSAAPLSGAKLAVATALAQVGKPYQWAGAGPSDYDCSGLVMYAWRAAGVSLPHYTVAQYEDTERISESQLEPGDLVFYDTGDGAQPGHVTIYIGSGRIITADQPGTDVRVESLTWDGRPMGFGRVR